MSDSMIPPLPEHLPFSSDLGSDPATFSSSGDDDLPTFTSAPSLVGQLQFTSFRLKSGSWAFTWGAKPDLDAPLSFGLSDGTFRFEAAGGILGGIRASGDLYARPVTFIPGRRVGEIVIGSFVLPGPAPRVDDGIPIFGIKQYRAYCRVTKVSNLVTNNSFTMEFSRYNWDTTNFQFAVDGSGQPVVAENYVVKLTWTTSPSGWPSSADYLTGEVKIKSSGASAGFIRMGWVSQRYRKISLEIDTVAGCRFPTANGAGRALRDLLEDAGLQTARLVQNENNIPDKAAAAPWADTDLHSIMNAHRLTVDLEKEWAYYCLVVPQITYFGDLPLGLMYDSGTGDLNNVPREGFAVSGKFRTGSGWEWGTEANKDLQDSFDAFLRTTIHEFSHALGLMHPEDMGEENDQTYTCPTRTIIKNSQETGVVFPNNVKWSHSPIARTRLWHYPDIRVRPGGIRWALLQQGNAPWIPPSQRPIVGPPIRIDVTPVLPEVPLGAPVRVDVVLKNEGDTAIEVPRNIGLGGEAMRGDVENPGGRRRVFSSFSICTDVEDPLVSLEPGEMTTTSMTLFSGADGPLFTSTGVHTITSILSWTLGTQQSGSVTVWLEAKTTVLVTDVRTPSHAAAAHQILTEPEVFLCVVLAGDHLVKGLNAVHAACKDETLLPHWACIEARRYGKATLESKPDLAHAKKLLASKNIVMSKEERRKLHHLLSH